MGGGAAAAWLERRGVLTLLSGCVERGRGSTSLAGCVLSMNGDIRCLGESGDLPVFWLTECDAQRASGFAFGQDGIGEAATRAGGAPAPTLVARCGQTGRVAPVLSMVLYQEGDQRCMQETGLG